MNIFWNKFIGCSVAVVASLGMSVAMAQDDLLLGGDTSSNDPLLASGSGDDLLSGGGSDDSLLSGASDPLLSGDLTGAEPEAEEETDSAAAQHAAIFVESKYPSANTCATCHPKQFGEWSVSQHAYAQLSPVFMAMQMTINSLTSSTNGDFCVRCHTQVGMNLGESPFMSNLDRNPTSREGVSCVVCHRVANAYSKVSGRLALVEGDIYQPVYGPTGNEELGRVLNSPGEYQVSASEDKPGRAIHSEAEKFFSLTQPAFCGTCHDVTLLNGFRLEEAFSEFKMSEAAGEGTSCQDCHMGKVQGKNEGYDYGPAAMVGGVPTKDRRLTNHFFAGPDYSIIHPGMFPHNVEATALATQREWLQFDYEAGWGTEEFEANIPAGTEFPGPWAWADVRKDARRILNDQFDRLAWAKEKRIEVLRNGYGLGEIEVEEVSKDGIDFKIDVLNLTNGHGVPTGFDAERLLFLQVTVTDPNGKTVYVSGDRDPNGDVRDSHSLYVHNGELPLDEDLFNLQSKFIVRTIRGGEREQILAVNTSIAALPFIRPETRATTLYGRPRDARKHKKTIEPLGAREADYSVDADQMTVSGTYTINMKLISQMVPVNLIGAIQGVGFDYGMSPMEIAENVVDGAVTIVERTATVQVGPDKVASNQ